MPELERQYLYLAEQRIKLHPELMPIQTRRSLTLAANHTARKRGHHMARYYQQPRQGNGACFSSICLSCKREVQLLTMPAPNEINMGGEALAINCDVAYIPSYHKDGRNQSKDDVTSQPRIGPKRQGQMLRKDVLSELEYLEDLKLGIQDLLSAARNGDPFKVLEASKAFKGNMETYPLSKVIRIDLHF